MPAEGLSESDIAIVGMSGRFPGAPDVDALWRHVRDGEDCLVDLDPEALIAAGLPSSVAHAPDYVRRTGIVDGVDQFDPGFFGVGKRDAAIMDPQHRLLLECAWEAIESSGHAPERFEGAIGVFAGCGVNTYLINNLLTNPDLVENVGWFLLRHTGNDKDFLATGISYRLDLRGPSINVQTACSTSLVAIHLAAQSLRSYECDMALAGGATIDVPTARGYHYLEGEVLAPDGYCRAFDERSGGTVLTPGAGMVALRRLVDAVRERDPILAVIKSSAVNNDGARKVGYLAPSVDGHADVVKEALAFAELSPRDIELLEAHGTGTAVGDPIEIAALTEAFRAGTDDTGFCRVASTKPNIGHLDTAAGVASVIKVVQALRHRVLPPMANHTGPSPLIDFPSTPFVLSGEASPWPSDSPRRAGVSSLGVGGTNAHAIVEEAPELEPSPPARPEQVLVLSGRTTQAVDDVSARVADFLEAAPDTNLADVAFTLAAGRRAHTHRRVVTATDVADAVRQLRKPDRRRSHKAQAPDATPSVAFLFPGGGAQYAGMAAGLDERFDAFHATMRDGIARVRASTGIDLGPLLRVGGDDDALQHPSRMLPAIFLTSVALARQWMAWGITPRALIGHSLGEYTAAHLAGVMSLDVALELVAVRARLIERVTGEGCSMLVVPRTEAEVLVDLPHTLSLATVNAPDECVISGPTDSVRAYADQLAVRGIDCTLVTIAAAGHSSLLDPVLPEFLDAVRGMRLDPPQLPYLSNLTGTWISAEAATNPQYWVDHLRHTVRFSDCLETALGVGPLVVVEVGPGQSLSSAARRQPAPPVAAIPTLRHPKDDIDDTAHALHAVGRLWATGVPVRVEQLSGPARRRLRLPTYPFQRERYWIEPGRRDVATTPELTASAAAVAANEHGIRRIDDIDDWFWEPAWIDAARTSPVEHAAAATGPWLLVGEPDDSLIRAIAAELGTRGVEVRTAAHFDPVQLGTTRAVAVVGGGARDLTGVDGAAKRWLGDAADAARALGAAAEGGTRLAAITRGATAASGAAFRPVDALALGPVLVAPQEYPDLATLLIDVDVDAEAERSAPAIVDELLTMSDRVVALRRGRRLIPELVRTPVAAPSSDRATFRAGGTYVVTGGLGGIGHAIAAHLATTHQANLVVVASEPVPAGDERAPWLARHGRDDATSRRITRLAELEQVGTKVAVVVADLADAGALRHALDEAERVVGRIDGAIHAAGRVRDRLIELATREDHEAVIGPKARAAAVLAEELERRGADLLVLVSSTSTALAPSGQTAYVAANAVLDSLAGTRARLRVVTINYGVWAGTGMAAELARRTRLGLDDGEPIVHPVLTQRHTDRAGNVSMTGTLDATHDWVVDEHRVEAGTSVLPGSAHLELMLAAAEFAAVGGRALRDVALVAPLVVTDDHPVAVKVTVTSRDAAGKRYVRIESDGGTGRSWHAHSEAELATNVDNTEHRLDLVGIVARCGLDGVDPLMSPRRHIHFGPRWDAVVDAALGDGESVGRLRLADAFVHDAGAWTAHPAIVDVATAFGVLLGHADDDRVLYVPIGYDSVVSHAPLAPEVHVHAVRTASTRDDLLRVDIALTDAEGRVQLQIGGLSLRPVRDPARFGTTAVEVDGAATRLAPLLALAEVHGIRSDEGPRLLERVLARATPRLVASSVDLAALLAPTVPEAGRAADQEPTAGRAHAAESVAEALTAIWVDLLGVSDITPDDDFFELGGHSLIAIRLMARVHRELGVRFQLATLFEAPTIASLAALIRAERPDLESALQDAAAVRETTSDGGTSATAPTTTATPSLSIVAIRATGAAEPLYVVHGAGGNVLNLWSLARALPEDRPLYGFQAHGVDGQDEPDPTIDAMAARYVDALRAHKPGPYLLGGYSGGGIVALEMAAKLRAAGEHVRYVVLFDSIPPEHVYPRNTTQLRHVIANLCIRGPKPVWPYLDEWARRTFRRVVPTPEARERARREQAREMGFIDVSEFGFVNLEPHFARIVREHRLGIYAVDALLLKADEVWPIHRHDYFWGGVITGTLDIRTVPGNHNTMFNPEHAATLAAALVPLLEAHAPR